MTFTRPGVQVEIDRFFKAIAKTPNDWESISKSAFSQSRKNLRPEAFIELDKSQLKYFEENAPYKKGWKGNRVISIDGSVINLPTSEELRREFGFLKNQHEEIICGRCSFAYDVCNELIIDSKFDGILTGEKELAIQHFPHLKPDSDILVFDRGYPSHWLIGLLMKQRFKFCFRLGSLWKDAYGKLENLGDDIDWSMVHRSHKGEEKLKDMGIAKQIDGLRLVSIKLSTGEQEVLLTNLTDREEFGIDDLKQLYHLRWGVEEAYKTFKKTLQIERFTGKSTIAVKQDFYAKVFIYNMASMIRTQGVVEKEGREKPSVQANKTQVLAKTKDFLVDLFYLKDLKSLLKQLLKIINKRLEIVRLGRSNPRKHISAKRFKGLNSKGI